MNLYEEARAIVAAYEAKYGRIPIVFRPLKTNGKNYVCKGIRTFTKAHRRKLKMARIGKIFKERK